MTSTSTSRTDHPSTVLVGTRKGLFVWEVNGDSATVAAHRFPGVPVSAVLADGRDGMWYAGLDHGHFGNKLHRSDDRGETWQEVATPEYPADAGMVRSNPGTPPDTPATTALLWCLEAAHPDQPGTLFCGTIPGGLFRSDDRGESWQLVRALWDQSGRPDWNGGGYDQPGIHSVVIDPRGPGRYVVGVSCGGAWRTTDDGASWEVGQGMFYDFMPPELAADPNTQDPHRIVRCRAAPDELWTQHHCGIFRSRDDGRTWTTIGAVSPSAFGFAVAVHPDRPDTAWFVPAESDGMRIPVNGEMVVTRTDDGGATFRVLRGGLPQEHAYHLVYRHCLDVSPDGERLALGSTTGSLWLGDGESFTALSTSLPPVLCVRWV